MTVFFNSLKESHLGYGAIFACIGLGFLFLRKVDRGEVGPGYWALSFFLGSLGFLFWSGAVPLKPWQYFLAGEVFHVSGFFALICGAYRFAGNAYKPWNFIASALWLVAWLGSIFLVPTHSVIAFLSLKILRAVLFIFAGILFLARKKADALAGRQLAGWSLVAWGFYVVLISFLPVKAMPNLAYGFLVGFQVIAAFGFVAMIVDRVRARAEASEKRAKRLEGFLPICSYCKRIRDKNNQWHVLESYIEERSTAEFSHGICPDCMKKYHPDQD
jgi:hypothetical protein